MNAVATDLSAASLKVREENYCFSHALQAASAYYHAALPASLDTAHLIQRIRAENAPRTPTARTRVQPPRGVKKTSTHPSSSPSSPRASFGRRVLLLKAEMPIPMNEDGRVLNEESWLGAVRSAIEEVTTRKVLKRYRERPKPCVFGAREWRCRKCDEEVRGRHPEVAWGGDEGEARALMEGVVEGRMEGRGWWDVKIPEGEVGRVGGLRFAVDVCDGDDALVMFV